MQMVKLYCNHFRNYNQNLQIFRNQNLIITFADIIVLYKVKITHTKNLKGGALAPLDPPLDKDHTYIMMIDTLDLEW